MELNEICPEYLHTKRSLIPRCQMLILSLSCSEYNSCDRMEFDFTVSKSEIGIRESDSSRQSVAFHFDIEYIQPTTLHRSAIRRQCSFCLDFFCCPAPVIESTITRFFLYMYHENKVKRRICVTKNEKKTTHLIAFRNECPISLCSTKLNTFNFHSKCGHLRRRTHVRHCAHFVCDYHNVSDHKTGFFFSREIISCTVCVHTLLQCILSFPNIFHPKSI